MGKSFVQRSADPFSDTSMGKITLDPLVITGSVFRYDFTNAFSNPNADGALSNGATFKNLVEGAGDATYTAVNGGFTVAAGKKGLTSPGTDSNLTSFLALPAGAFDMHTETGDHAFIQHMWHKEVTGYQTTGGTSYGDRINGGETSAIWGATPAQFVFATGQPVAGFGAAPNVYIRAAAIATSPTAVAVDALLNASHLLSIAYEGGTIKYYVDGALFSSIAWANAFGLPSRRSHGSFVFAGQPAAADTVTVNGNAITFVAGAPAGAQVQIGADATATALALKTYINANKVTLNATAEGTGTTLAVLQRDATLLTLAKSSANITVGAVVAAKSIRMGNYMKGDFYCIAGEDLTASGRTAGAAALSEYNGFRARLTALGL